MIFVAKFLCKHNLSASSLECSSNQSFILISKKRRTLHFLEDWAKFIKSRRKNSTYLNLLPHPLNYNVFLKVQQHISVLTPH